MISLTFRKTILAALLSLSSFTLFHCVASSDSDPTSSDTEEVVTSEDNISFESCGGIIATSCESGYVCVDKPFDGCDPNNGGADCSGICIKKKQFATCGGIAAIPCPSGTACVDDPTDDCDPKNGGADCSGICVP